jgi:hypothetical protein
MIYAMSDVLRHGRSLLLVVTLTVGAAGWAVSWAAEDAAPQQPAAGKATHAKAEAAAEAQQRKSSARLPAPGTPTKGVAQPSKQADRLDLDPSVVTGNRELPKVMYIVPWKKAEPGDLPAQPFNTLLDEALTPVDRDVFRREVTYYGAVSATANSADTSSPSVAQHPEK